MKKFKNIYWIIIVILLSPTDVFAALGVSGPGCEPGKLCNPLQFNTISGFLDAMLGALVTIATPIVVLMLVYSGFLFVSAQGNPEKLEKAKKAIVWTIIGAVIVLGAFVLTEAIEGTVSQIKS